MASLLSYALTNVADVKELLGIASSDLSYDNLIIRKINQATRAIEAYCGRRFALTVYTDEVYNGNGTNQLVLRQRPIVGTVILESRDTSLNQDSFESIDSELFFSDANSGVLDLTFSTMGYTGAYQISYSAGYSTIPEDLAEACATLAAYYVNAADVGLVGVSEKREGQRSVRYQQANNSNTFESILGQLGIDQIINSYANFPVATDR